jgi:hypothetical protein
MKTKTFLILVSVFLVLDGFMTIPAYGSIATSEPPTNVFMSENAEIIAVCRVKSVDVGFHSTVYSFETMEAIKGIIPKGYVITTKEGITGHTSPPQVRFEVEQTYLVYLCEKNGVFSVFFGEWGKTPLVASNTGLLDSLRETYDGTISMDVHPVSFVSIPFIFCVLVYFHWWNRGI